MKRRIALALLLSFIALPALATVALHPVLTVSQYSESWNEVEVVIDNPSSQSEDGYLVVYFTHMGVAQAYGFLVTVPAQTQKTLDIDLMMNVNVTNVEVYTGGFPDGVTEAPDPVLQRVKESTDPI